MVEVPSVAQTGLHVSAVTAGLTMSSAFRARNEAVFGSRSEEAIQWNMPPRRTTVEGLTLETNRVTNINFVAPPPRSTLAMAWPIGSDCPSKNSAFGPTQSSGHWRCSSAHTSGRIALLALGASAQTICLQTLVDVACPIVERLHSVATMVTSGGPSG
jgi:hypothetical protein